MFEEEKEMMANGQWPINTGHREVVLITGSLVAGQPRAITSAANHFARKIQNIHNVTGYDVL